MKSPVHALGVSAIVAIAGCATVAPVASPPPAVTSEQVVERSYTLGKEEVAFVGGTIARVKDYRLDTTTRQGVMRASKDFTIFYPLVGPTVMIRTTDPIPIAGTTQRDGKTYRLVTLRNPYVRFLLNDDGTFEGSAIGLADARMGYTYSPNPADVMLVPDTAASTVSSKGYINFELVYSGATKDSIRLLYREYTQQDLVRPAFTQDLVYERDSATIRFRNMLLKIIQATGEQIRFVVMEDGYLPSKR
jgi:hypothetical protein